MIMKVWGPVKYDQLLVKLTVLISILSLSSIFLFFTDSPSVIIPFLENNLIPPKQPLSLKIPESTSDQRGNENPFLDNDLVPFQQLASVQGPENSVDHVHDEGDEVPFVVNDILHSKQNTSLHALAPDQIHDKEECDLFSGEWVPNPSGPNYTNESCRMIEGPQNCMMNGRPDSNYLYWKWSPHNCRLSPFNADRFFKFMRNKSWGLIGDSISRNHFQSLLCMLSTVEQPIELYHDEEYRSKRWYFSSHNFTVSLIWSPFLMKAATFEDMNGISTAEIELHLDKIDEKWTDAYDTFDFVIFSTGEWYPKPALYYENETLAGCHYCPGKNLTELGFDYAYRKALRHVFNFIIKSGHKGSIFFRTSTPDHFQNGQWYTGGSCPQTGPVKDGEFELSDLNRNLHEIEVSEFEIATRNLSKNGVDLKLLDFTKLLLVRPDGHPGPYRFYYPFANGTDVKVTNDCLHWCLPGPIDTWNDLIMEMITGSREDLALFE